MTIIMLIPMDYGSYRMADFLNKSGYGPNGGGKFTSIKVELNMTYRQFCSEWGGDNLLMDVVG